MTKPLSVLFQDYRFDTRGRLVPSDSPEDNQYRTRSLNDTIRDSTKFPGSINDDTSIQLDLIDELVTIFRRAGMRFWLRGGWAIDFMLGRVTRSHSDVDLVTWKRHSSRIPDMLVALNFELSRDLGVQMDFHKSGQTISIVFISKDKEGHIFTPGIPEFRGSSSDSAHLSATVCWASIRNRDCILYPGAGTFVLIRPAQTFYERIIPEWVWYPKALSLRRHSLNSVSCLVVSPVQLLEEKKGYERGTGRPPRSKDIQSMSVLQMLIQD